MPLKTDPTDLGINSWLEGELYQQYLNDRTAVDESWKHVFEDAPNGQPEIAPPSARPVARSVPAPGPTDALQPLRGIAAKIAENMNASVTIPLATSQRVIPVKVMDENRRIINPAPHAGRQEQGLLHAPDRLGHRNESAGRFSRPESCLRRSQRPARAHRASARQPGHRCGCGGERRRTQPAGPQHQERRSTGFRPVRHHLRRPSGPTVRARASSRQPISRTPPFP